MADQSTPAPAPPATLDREITLAWLFDPTMTSAAARDHAGPYMDRLKRYDSTLDPDALLVCLAISQGIRIKRTAGEAWLVDWYARLHHRPGRQPFMIEPALADRLINREPPLLAQLNPGEVFNTTGEEPDQARYFALIQ